MKEGDWKSSDIELSPNFLVFNHFSVLIYHCSMHYAKLAAAGYKGGLSLPPSVGDFCCAKFTQDDTWYRVLVTAIEESDKGLNILTG